MVGLFNMKTYVLPFWEHFMTFLFFHDFLSYIFYSFLTSGILYFKDIGHTLLVLGSLFFSLYFSFPHFHLWHFAFYSAIVSELSPLNFLLNIFTYISVFNIKKNICSYFKNTKPLLISLRILITVLLKFYFCA